MLDERLPQNLTGREGGRIVLVRCSDGTAFAENRSNRTPPEYVMAANHLSRLSPVDRAIAGAKLREYQQNVKEYRDAARRFTGVLNTRRPLSLAREEVDHDAPLRMVHPWARLRDAQMAFAASERRRADEAGEQQRAFDDDNRRALDRQELLAEVAASLVRRQQSEADAIQSLFEARQIHELVHFTRAENLLSILKSGLIPRGRLHPDWFIANDESRIDGLLEASCLSISFPNYRMLYKYRQIDNSRNWAVLRFRTAVVLTKPCLFVPNNASSRGIPEHIRVSRQDFAGAGGLAGMFAEPSPGFRSERGITNEMTTDPQAEVLVFDVVEPQLIKGICLLRQDDDLQRKIQAIAPTVPIDIGSPLFRLRVDYAWWNGPSGRESNESVDDILSNFYG